ncbi:glyoxalase superfamily protein [Rhabdobacter roseus]|uniref:Bleomycin resistance protein n=1 Tax=Rhabdobacter roseus TaxID=1655419 RepID=A0A840TKE9_9BACT|nr:glyoxalase superfamily protein [Rhabdobacter roseus]MBB5282277.1 putative glyoxalase superfamily protein PhnB [Rhabdobacter roseus]
MKINQVIPILRIFDEAKAFEFYLDWLGFTVDWTHRFEEGTPLYMQISQAGMTLHLSEHHGDSTPGIKVFLACEGLAEFHAELIAKKYKYNRPGLETAFWNALTMEVNDPFGNKLLFSEALPTA